MRRLRPNASVVLPFCTRSFGDTRKKGHNCSNRLYRHYNLGSQSQTTSCMNRTTRDEVMQDAYTPRQSTHKYKPSASCITPSLLAMFKPIHPSKMCKNKAVLLRKGANWKHRVAPKQNRTYTRYREREGENRKLVYPRRRRGTTYCWGRGHVVEGM